jgi:hypothetical protein
MASTLLPVACKLAGDKDSLTVRSNYCVMNYICKVHPRPRRPRIKIAFKSLQRWFLLIRAALFAANVRASM